ncbi:MAG: sigma-70 family RNA polymerase sigma factor [Fusobacteria bacterium]|nr:sigma-70 family RNA polymerase sigma factor [Fusobacteriota bacterium]
MELKSNQFISLYQGLADDEIIDLIKGGDKFAENYLISKYKAFVISKVKDFYLQGGDLDDLIQEGMIGLYKGILSYKRDEASSFRNFADLCIRRQVITAIRSANRLKNQPLNNCLSLNDSSSKEDTRGLEDILEARSLYCPEDVFLGKERIIELEKYIKMKLSPMEWQVVYEYINGSSFEEISKEFSLSIKSVYNAIDRSRKKITEVLRENP